MPEIGQILSHFRLVEKIGEGGMGEVYLADDTTLDRKVALKFLPDAFTGDPERMARFEREAKLLASLNHPNIAGIYGLEQADGNRFLVLEYVEGETLQARLSKGALPLEDALELCRQIAEGLEAAHEKGVIHRDLKPANVMITAEEKVKILDFGLAKAFSDETQSIDSSQSPTLTEAMTRPGVILGTAAYMSPEQAKGKSVDKRADIWAFGCILYECLTGKRAFEGETVTETLAAVIKEEPDWNRLPPNIHPQIRFLLKRCLKKEPKTRYHDIADACVDIQEVLADPGGVLVQPVTVAEAQTRSRLIIPWIVAILGILIVGVAVWHFRAPEPRQVMRFEYELPEGQDFNLTGPVLAISPDGTQYVYSTTRGLYLHSVDELRAKLIAGSEGNTQQPFFSPDGKWIGYLSLSDQQLKKIPVSGGTPELLCTINDQLMGASWSEDDSILYSQPGTDIMLVSANGGSPESLVKAKSGILGFPQLLPGGNSILYHVHTGTDLQQKIVVLSLKTGEARILLTGSGARYLPTGHLVYGVGTNVYAVPFDLEKLKISGTPVLILQSVREFAASDSGTLIYIPEKQTQGSQATVLSGRTLIWVDRNGREERLDAPPNMYHHPDLSPDGTKVAVNIGFNSIWIWDLMQKTLVRLTFEGVSLTPVWTPDGKRIVFYSSGRGGGDKSGIFWRAADGTGEDEQLASATNFTFPYCWSSDGKALIGTESPDGQMFDIWTLSLEGDHLVKPLLNKDYLVSQPRISPNGRWIAYISSKTQREEVYVRPFPDVDKGQWQISTTGGDTPLWSPDGGELFYMSGDAVVAIPVNTEDQSFQILGNPKVLFRGPYACLTKNVSDAISWDISPDGKRFLMIKEADPPASDAVSRKIIFVTNWFKELKEKAPAL